MEVEYRGQKVNLFRCHFFESAPTIYDYLFGLKNGKRIQRNFKNYTTRRD